MTGDEIPKTVSLELITKVAGKLEQWGKRLFKSKKPQAEEPAQSEPKPEPPPPDPKVEPPRKEPETPSSDSRSDEEKAFDDFVELF
jgi:hypothetical protein